MTQDDVSIVFAALADPTRRRILERLEGGPLTVGKLAEPFAVSAPAISQHLGVLERAGLITRVARAQWREIALRPESVTPAAEWIRTHHREWSARLDRMAERLVATQTDEAGEDDER